MAVATMAERAAIPNFLISINVFFGGFFYEQTFSLAGAELVSCARTG
jgi:hypothetical protein